MGKLLRVQYMKNRMMLVADTDHFLTSHAKWLKMVNITKQYLLKKAMNSGSLEYLLAVTLHLPKT